MQRRKGNSTGSKDGSMQSGSKHQWTTTEDVKLVECLVDMANSGSTWKAENGFKFGYLSELEKIMLEKIPGYKLRAQPHIQNKYRLLKKQYGAISNMLRQGSRFGWDDRYKCLVCDPDIFQGWVKVHH
jgi:hypothetical protein